MSDNAMPELILSWVDGTDDSQQQRLTPSDLPATLGRDATCKIVIPSGQISRRHAELTISDGEYVITDLDSHNGIWVNNERVRQPIVLKDGMVFRIRPCEFTVMIGSEDEQVEVPQLDDDATIPLPDSAGAQLSLTWYNTEEPSEESSEPQKADIITPATIGRNDSCTIPLPSKKISREHAQIVIRENALAIVDSGSINGLTVNGRKESWAYLHRNDEIQIGPYLLQVTSIDPTLEADPHGTISATDSAARASHVHPLGDDDPTLGFSNPASSLSSESAPDPLFEFDPQAQDDGQSAPNFPPAIFQDKEVSVDELRRTNFQVEETTYLAIGGGLGSFVWVDHLLIYGADSRDIVSIGFDGPKPYSRYSRLCKNSQIPSHERLRSNSDSCPDNIWGWPGYAVREAWHEGRRGNVQNALGLLWQIFSEPTFANTYTPRSGNVFQSIDREAERIRWDKIWRSGRVKQIRKTTDGRYAIAYTETQRRTGQSDIHRLMIAQYVHISVGYPAIRLLKDLYEYRKATEDFKRVVNAYEPHDRVYRKLEDQGGVVLLRGRGIVASRILQRLYEARIHNPNISILHLMRGPVPEGASYMHAQRFVEHHWEFQPFNWPKSCWGGDLRKLLEDATEEERKQLLNDWGGTTTADRDDWREIVSTGLREGWYQQAFGEVEKVDFDRRKNTVVTSIRGSGGIQGQTDLNTDFIIDATGLLSGIDSHPLLDDLLKQYRLKRNPLGRLRVQNDFELRGMRNDNGRIYAAGIITLGGPHAAVDSFLGLQYAALRSVDALVAAGAPGLRYLEGFRSVRQWLRWARGVQP